MARIKINEWLEPEKLILLEGWAGDGLTDEQIAENMGIGVRTLYRWKNENCQFRQALKKGKDAADREIENALFKRAKGYDVTETRTKEKNGEAVERTTITRHIPGDTTAQIFWLKNRKPAQWRDSVANDANEINTGRNQTIYYMPEKEIADGTGDYVTECGTDNADYSPEMREYLNRTGTVERYVTPKKGKEEAEASNE